VPKKSNRYGTRGKITSGYPGYRDTRSFLLFDWALGDIFKVKFIEVCETTIPAPDGKMAAPDFEVMWACCVAVPAVGITHQFPEVITPDLCITPGFFHILDPRDEDPCRTAVVALHLCLGRHGLDNLIGFLPAVITAGTVFGENEAVFHVVEYPGVF
jgi:hypothetical protein